MEKVIFYLISNSNL